VPSWKQTGDECADAADKIGFSSKEQRHAAECCGEEGTPSAKLEANR